MNNSLHSSPDASALTSADLPKKERLLSLDALRGFDMLWIIGGGATVAALARTGLVPKWMGEQMQHLPWEGFHFYDLIFPLFVFITGATIPFSVLPRAQRGESSWRITRRLARRAATLVILGMVYNGVLRLDGFANTDLMSVLGLIGFGWFFAAIICLHGSVRAQVAWAAGILVVQAAAMLWAPVPGVGAGVLTPTGSFGSWVDQMFVPGRLHYTDFSGVGWMPCIAAISTALIGSLAGQWLKDSPKSGSVKALGLIAAGLLALLIAWLGSWKLPIIKGQCTSTYVLCAAGWSLLLLAVFYWVLDVRGWKRLGVPFAIVGMNAILIYLLQRIVDFTGPSRFLFGGLARLAGSRWEGPIIQFGALLLAWGLLAWLWRRRVFIKI